MSTALAGSSAYRFGEPELDILQWVQGGLFAALGAVSVAAINAWRKPNSRVELEDTAHRIANNLLAGMEARVKDLETRSAQCEADGRAMAARLDTVEGENRQLKQLNASLIDELRAVGIDVTAREMAGSFTVIERDRVTTLKPVSKKPQE